MFSSKRKSGQPQSRIDSLIGAGTRIEGDVKFTGGLRIDGEVKGNVYAEKGADSTLVISEQAQVEGEICVAHVVINGTVVGPVFAAETLELLPNAKVTGDVEYSTLEMQQGAVVQGRLIHQAGKAEPVELKLAASAG
ncbi:polymer-forming cytoskeletal protein [Oryzomicrobium sp.]|uniref:bactofilin family protein n=1 Tax=Oryzomicrobium sp. TaxID=1911578 RepID=UPI0025D4C45D|nr:polymer-forming cytoskeletal protein [Oryzomicrobium sp.]MCE1244232.1 polymer-forming cytoskeletal protein [Oryzomicrobium sp.]